MYHGESDDGSGSDSSDFSSVPIKKKRNKTKELTWAEAAEIILKRFDHPLPPKEVLRLMQEDDLKTSITAASPVAVLNAVLNNQSKGVNPLFYKCPTGASSYGLVRTRKKPDTTTNKIPPPKQQTQMVKEIKELPKREPRITKKLNPPTAQISRPLNPPGKVFPTPSSLRVKKPLIPPGEKTPVTNMTNRYTPPLGSLSKAAYLERLKQQPQHRRMMGPTTSALVRPSPPFSRPPPGAALRVMPPKKRVKIDQDENDSDSSTQSKNDDEPVRKRSLVTKIKINNEVKKGVARHTPPRAAIKQQIKQSLKLPRSPSTPEFKNKINHRSISRTANNKTSAIQRKLTPPTINTNKQLSQMKKSSSQPSLQTSNRRLATSSSSSLSRLNTASTSAETKDNNKFFSGTKFKKFRKGGYTAKQETKIDLMRPDSVLSSVQIKDLFNASTFRLLPPAYQYQLLMLLPECDRISNKDGSLRLSSACFNNGFFSRACQEYKDKLMDGDLNSDIITRAKQEIKTYSRLDPWKVKHFEPVYGQSSIKKEDIPEDERPHENIKPIQSSWIPFLKFAENSTDEYEKSLSKIQSQVKETREREAKEKEEAERQRKEELSQRLNILSSPSSSTSKLNKTPFRCAPLRHQSSLARSPHVRSPMTSRPPTNRNSSAESSKEKSKRALKRAQLLQRKKIFDKQLKDAKARILEEARLNSTRNESRKAFLTRSSSTETSKNITTVANSTADSLSIEIKPEETSKSICSTSTTPFSTLSISSSINTTNISSVTTTTTTNPLLQKFIRDSETAVAESSQQVAQQPSTTSTTANVTEEKTSIATTTTPVPFSTTSSNTQTTSTTTTTCNHKATDTTIIKTASNSKIVQGAANFGTNSNGSCPCNVKAMFLCKQCGSVWHGDCLNSDKICISCS